MPDNSSYRARVGERDTRVLVGEAGLDIGDRLVPWLDVDRVSETGHRVALGLASGDDLVISDLGSVHDRFMVELRDARRRARLASLTVAVGEPSETFVSREPSGWIDLHLFDDVVVLDHRSGETQSVPLSLVIDIRREGHDFVFVCRGLGEIRVGKLGAGTDRFADQVERMRREQRARLAARCSELDHRLSEFSLPDGWTVSDVDEPRWWSAIRDVARSGQRASELESLERLADRPVRLGVATVDDSTPKIVCLASRSGRVAVETLSEQDRATYVFATDDVDRLNAALVVASFRREVIALPDDSLGRWAVAARTSPLIRELRGCLVARVEHRQNWLEGVQAALGA